MKRKKPTVIGMTCGIGSMLIGARAVGFSVLGNVEWRRYYHATDPQGRNTFMENFPGTFLVKAIDEIPSSCPTQIDLLMGHPECGNFSQLSNANPTRLAKLQDAADIPLFVDSVAMLRPRFFVMDDLPKSLGAFDMSEYAKRLPDYDLFPEWISNYHYGNPQKNRKRMFMIGALKKERFVFRPGEQDHGTTVKDVLHDIQSKYNRLPNHHRHVLDVRCGKAKHMLKRDEEYTWREVSEHFKKMPEGWFLQYVKEDGTVTRRPGTYKGYWDGHSHVLDGGSPAINPKTNLPFSLRERLRIQGAPDDFVLYGEKLDGKRWDHYVNMALIKQTGKFMPVQFCTFIAAQIFVHINKVDMEISDERFIVPNEFVDEAKRFYCHNVGYSKQKDVCDACWITDCGMNKSKTRLSLPPSVKPTRQRRTASKISKPKIRRTFKQPSGKKLTNI